jgi:hypothetical protein
MLWSVPIDGSTPRALLALDDPLMSFGRGAFAAHDSTIYLTQLRSESDVWVTELTGPNGSH